MINFFYNCLTVLIVLSNNLSLSAQDTRAQYPAAFINSYFGVNIGYINYGFSQRLLEPGYEAGSVYVPHTAVRILFGHRFNKYLSAQLSYMRPVNFVEYRNMNGTHLDYQVGMNVAGLSFKASLPLSKKIEISADAGVSIVTRGGFIVINAPGVKDVAFAKLLLGTEAEYHLNKKWDLTLSAAWSPAHEAVRQPATYFYSAGFNYTMRPLPKEKVEQNANSGFIFPRQIIQAGYTTNVLGYGVNDFVSKGAIPIFWSGAAQVEKGFSLNYLRNIFHTAKVFSFDWGAGISYWESKNMKEKFYTVSLYPVFRFTALRLRSADIYFNYSFGGPAYISKKIIDEKDTGKKFTFQDFMGIGVFAGKKRNFNTEIRIAHYSNGNIFPQNNGVMVPLTLNAGYSF